ncbi:MAG: carbamoylphosphate synthase large subunit, partial [Clostridiales bacterium]|nr:carbamoylphosphate synthase large subunit [Clostridiales bacterium]
NTQLTTGEKFYCAFAGRRNGKEYALSEEQVKEKFADNLKLAEKVPDVLSGAMGNYMFVAAFKTKKDMQAFYTEILK